MRINIQAIGAVALVAMATGAARGAGDADDVRKTMKTMASQIAAGKLLDALGNYYTVNDGEKDLARASVELDEALGKLEAAVRTKFGDKAWNAVGATVNAVPAGVMKRWM
jgi:hypothetical protein